MGGRGVDVENVITTTALFRRIDGVKGVSWCGVRSVTITEQYFVFAVLE